MMTSSKDSGDIIRGGDDFNDYFDPDVYLAGHFKNLDEPYSTYNVNSLHKIFSSGRVQGHRLLDIGSGPSIHSVIPAAKWFDEIILTDFTHANREKQRQWLNKEPNRFDWTPYFKWYSKLAGNENSWEEMERELRTKIKGVYKCDVNSSTIIDPMLDKQVDAISSCTCLDSACSDIAAYQKAIQNMVSLLKTNGKLILVGVLNCQYYRVGAEVFSSLLLNKSDVLCAINMAGLEMLEYFEFQVPLPEQDVSLFIILAEKKL